MIRRNIDSDSVYFKTDTKYLYEDKVYQDRNAVVNKFLEQNPIIAEKTSSNPSKIIKDYEYQQLDGTKVYNVDQKDYVKVYKNALGKVVLPTCSTNASGQKGCVVSDKTAEQRALDSYVNGGLIRPKYTYAFGGSQNWYDSPTEAEIAYKDSDFTIKKSLFYFYNGQYYNAFNKSDLKMLKDTQFNHGYYYNGATRDLKVKVDPSEEIRTFWDTNDNFEGELKQGLSRIFQEKINDLFDYETKIVIQLNPPSGERIENFQSSDSDLVDFDASTNQLTIKNDLREKEGLDIPQLLHSLHDKSSSKWETQMIYTSVWWIPWEVKDYNRYKYSSKIKDVSVSFELNTDGNGADWGANETHPEKIEAKLAEDKMDKNIMLERESNNLLLKGLINLPSFSASDFDLNDLASNTALHNNVDIDDMTLSVYRRSNPLNWDQRFKDEMFEMYFNRLKKPLFEDECSDKVKEEYSSAIKNKCSPVFEDWTYGTKSKPAQFSVYESQKQYREKILNEEIIHKTSDNNEQVSWKSSAGIFTTSWKNWEKNFYYLEQDNEVKQIPLRLMYYVAPDKNQDISEFSDFSGETIASSEIKAKNIAFMSKEEILRKQYFIYDINGQVTISADDEETAITKLKNKVSLDYTYININEVSKLNDQDLSWGSIISDGFYTVYKFKSSVGTWLYFMSFDSAYKQFQNQNGLITGISQETAVYYRYIFNYKDKNYIFDWSDDQQINEIVNKIYQIIKKEKR